MKRIDFVFVARAAIVDRLTLWGHAQTTRGRFDCSAGE
jgi:hypothetical protein